MSFPADEITAEHWQRVLRALRDAIEQSIGLKEAAYLCDVAPTTFCDALAERERKVFHARWLVALLVRLPAAGREMVIAELADAAGYAVQAAKPLTDAQKLAALEESIREQFGPAGEKVIQQHRRARSRR